jgi:hypothetical protein
MLEVYALRFDTKYIISIDKSAIRNNYNIGVKINNSDLIGSLNMVETLKNLKSSNKFKADYFGDFRTFIIIRFQNGKRRKFYITGTGYIIENKKVYEPNLNFLKMAYYYLPDNFKPYYKIWENN